MKNSRYLLPLLAVYLFLNSTGCRPTCTAPSISFNPAGTGAIKAPAEVFQFDIIVTGDKNDIYSIIVTKTAKGISNPNFLSITGVSSKAKTITVIDSVPNMPDFGSTIVYNVKATSDCKAGTFVEKPYTITIQPSTNRIEDSIGNTLNPRIYSRFTKNSGNNKAWNLQNLLPIFDGNANSDKDICDSATVANPFTTATWGSRNGSLFKKVNSLSYSQASNQSIVNAWNSGGSALNLVSVSPNDNIIVNIKNTNRFALVKVKTVTDDGTATENDYTYFEYKLAQK